MSSGTALIYFLDLLSLKVCESRILLERSRMECMDWSSFMQSRTYQVRMSRWYRYSSIYFGKNSVFSNVPFKNPSTHIKSPHPSTSFIPIFWRSFTSSANFAPQTQEGSDPLLEKPYLRISFLLSLQYLAKASKKGFPMNSSIWYTLSTHSYT